MTREHGLSGSRPAAAALGLALLALALAAPGCGLLPAEEEILDPPLLEPGRVEYRTEAVVRGTLVSEVRMTAAFVSESQRNLSFESLGGRLKAIHVRYGQAVSAGDPVAELDTGELESRIRIQAIEVEKAALSLERLRAQGADDYAVRWAALELEQQRIRQDDLLRQRDAARLVSPIDGVVTYLLSLPVGDPVNAYQMVARVADTSRLVLVTTDSRAGELPVGARVAVSFRSVEMAGVVTANPSTLASDPDESLRKAAIVRLEEGIPEGAALGSTARIIHELDRREQVLLLSRSALRQVGGRTYVHVLDDGVRIERDVELGLVTDTQVEIVRGLAEGDRVILG